MGKKGQKIMYIMGIQSVANKDSGAAIVKCSDDGELLDFMAISEERLNRIKHSYKFPVHSIGYCMDHFGLTSLDQIDLLITDYNRCKRWFNSGPSYNITDYDYLKIKMDINPGKIRTTSHHVAHAASAYYVSGFDEAAILVVDGIGSDLETTSYHYANGDNIKFLERCKYYGIGACYSSISSAILSMGKSGEGKTMGLAPYGKDYEPVLEINAKLDGIKTDLSSFMKRLPFSDVLNQIDHKNNIYPFKKEYRRCSKKEDLLNPYFSRIAYDLQEETERVLLHLAKDLHAKTKSKNLCISGGVGLNSVSNKVVLDNSGFQNVFIFPACADDGIPFGLAMWGYYNCKELGNFKRRRIKINNAYTGLNYSDGYIIEVFKKYNIPYSNVSLHDVAKLLADGKVVGWFYGGSEYGPRALGHRSILVDSRRDEMKDILNLKIKHRESFRPFAPSILREYCSDYFDIEGESPYMLLIAQVRRPDEIPAVTHVDQTARVQTVTREHNGRYYELINEFYKITGVPCILNTSFNVAGEPIVETPEDAIICFASTEMDYLVIEDYLVDAKSIDKKTIHECMGRDRDEKIKFEKEGLLKKYFKGYDKNEKDHFIAEYNKISEWNAKYSVKYELEKKVMDWRENRKRILIVGTRDHTEILPKYITYFNMLDIAGFCNYNGLHDKGHIDKTKYEEYGMDALKTLNYDEILISSYEYNFEIYEYLSNSNIGEPIHMIYNNSSRNLMDTFNGFPQYK